MKLKKYLFPIIYSILLIAFTVYIVLDTFVIVRVYEPVGSGGDSTRPSFTLPPESSELETPAESGTLSPGSDETDETEPPEETEPIITEPIITENSYKDNNISINIIEYFAYNTKIYVADVRISSPEYLKTAFAKDQYGRNITQKTSTMAENNGAILAVNGDYYGARENGYVIRNSVLYRNIPAPNRDALAIFDDGRMAIIEEKYMTAEILQASGAMQVLSFGPGLVIDGEIVVGEKDEVAVASSRGNPRTAIGEIDELHYLIIVSDGRTQESTGLSLYQLAEFMQSLGVITGYNLDGGGSSTMWFNGKILNYPTTDGKKFEERSVSDIVYIGN